MTIDAGNEIRDAKPAPIRLRRRAEFLRVAASGVSRQSRAFKLQMATREEMTGAPRFGFTVTKKVAGAVGRNRIRRRLKEALRLAGALAASEGCDYVFVARRAALVGPFSELKTQMTETLVRLSAAGASSRTPTPRNRPQKP